MSISTTTKPLCSLLWERVGAHPSSLPDLIPTTKRLFRRVDMDTDAKMAGAVEHVIEKFIWETNNTSNYQDHRWRRDAYYIANHSLGNTDLQTILARAVYLKIHPSLMPLDV